MTLSSFSDTHGLYPQGNLPTVDVLIVCGDITRNGVLREVEDFCSWLSVNKSKHKIIIAGNHDWCFETDPEQGAKIVEDFGFTYLNDSGIEIDGIHFWGSPITPTFYDWAFNRDRGASIKKHWDKIPDNTDVLITHGPPYGILDLVPRGEHTGCRDLLRRIEIVKPKFHCFGHIHCGYGLWEKDGTKFINCASTNERYRLVNAPVVFTL